MKTLGLQLAVMLAALLAAGCATDLASGEAMPEGGANVGLVQVSVATSAELCKEVVRNQRDFPLTIRAENTPEDLAVTTQEVEGMWYVSISSGSGLSYRAYSPEGQLRFWGVADGSLKLNEALCIQYFSSDGMHSSIPSYLYWDGQSGWGPVSDDPPSQEALSP